MARHGVLQLALGDLNLGQLEETKAELMSQSPKAAVLLLELDVRLENSVDEALAKTVAAFGRVDYAINNAGISGPFAPTENVPFQEWERLFDVNIHGVWRCQRAELQTMMKQELCEIWNGSSSSKGVIINVASILGIVGSSAQTPASAYSASKHAVMGLTKTDARYYAKHGIRINAICPGYIETPLLHNLNDTALKQLISRIPAGRLGKAEEVGDAVVFMSSYLSSFMYGHGLVLDGGQLSG